MRIKFAAVFLATLVLAPGAWAQGTAKPKATLQAEISSCFPDNAVGAITPATMRACVGDFLASWQQYAAVNAQAGTSYTIQASDYGQLVTFNNAGSIAVTLPSGSVFSPFNFTARNIGTGTATITTASGTINGLSSYSLIAGQSVWVVSDGTNWQTVTGSGAVSTGGGIVSNGGTILIEQMNPGGRVTVALASGAAVCNPSTDQVAQTSIYYAPCAGQWVPIYDGSNMELHPFTSGPTDQVGLSVTLGSNWAANTLYDEFVGLNAGVVTFCTGPAWASSTSGSSSRGTGAGTTQIAVYKGYKTNAVSMTCRYSNTAVFTCGVNQCTKVGTLLTGASAGTVDLKFGTAASGGGAARISVCNDYNRADFRSASSDTSSPWSYTAAAWRAANAGNTQIAIVSCDGTMEVSSKYIDTFEPTATSVFQFIGVGLNSSTLLATRSTSCNWGYVSAGVSSAGMPCQAFLDEIPPAGLSTFYAIEQADGTHATTFAGQASPFNFMQLSAFGRM